MRRAHPNAIPKRASGHVMRELLRLCSADAAEERGLLMGAVVSVLLTVLFRTLEPWPLKLIYDFIFRQKHGRTATLHLAGFTFPAAFQHSFSLIWIAVLSLVLLNALAGTFDYLSSVAMGLAASRILFHLRARLFRHLQALDMTFHCSRRIGDVTASVTADIDRLRDVTVSALLPFISNGLALVTMVGVMLWMNWRLGLLVLFAFPLFYLAVTTITRRIDRVAREQRKRDGAIAATAAEAISAIQTIQAFGLEDEFANRFRADNQGSLDDGNRALRLSSRLQRAVDLLASVTMAGVLLLGAGSVLNGKLTAGDLIVFVSYLRNSFKPIRQTARYLAQISKAIASGGRVISLLAVQPAIVDATSAKAANGLAGNIKFEHVSFAYRSGHPVLSNISFEVSPGESVAIVGPSGSGKSTLAALLLRFYDPVDGKILIDGEDIRSYTVTSLREAVSVVMQDTVLFTGSIEDNIRFGARDASDAQIRLAAARARAADFIEPMRQGYQTQVGERGVTLSGGQRQRIAIARACLRRSSILLLDEATTGLDSHNRLLVLSALRELSATRTTITITHDATEARHADRILFLREGHLEEQGTHEQLMRRGGLYRDMYLQQAHANFGEEIAHAV